MRPQPRVGEEVEHVGERGSAARRALAETRTTALHHGVVAVEHAVHQQLAEAGDREDLLGEHRARESRPNSMAPSVMTGISALRSACFSDHQRAPARSWPAPSARSRRSASAAWRPACGASSRRPRRCRARTTGSRMRGQVRAEVLPRRHVARGGQPAEAHREEQDQHDAEPEVRHREPRRARAGWRRRRAAVPLRAAETMPAGMPDHERDEHRADRQLHRHRQLRARAARSPGSCCAATRRGRRAGRCRSRCRTAPASAGRGGTSRGSPRPPAGSCSSPASARAASPGRSCWSEKISTETKKSVGTSTAEPLRDVSQSVMRAARQSQLRAPRERG